MSAPRERLVGIFEFRSHPIADPAHVRRRRSWADRGINGWYVVIDKGGGIDDAWQWRYGLTWLHPDPGVREWRCSACGEIHDRDVNAARNILTLGLSAQPPAEENRVTHGR